jgi:hypothetical protein
MKMHEHRNTPAPVMANVALASRKRKFKTLTARPSFSIASLLAAHMEIRNLVYIFL